LSVFERTLNHCTFIHSFIQI